jgi:hypothetical protein
LPAAQLKVTFKEGGAFDFHNNFERLKERMQQALELSQESGRGSGNVDLSTIHLEELPAYTGPQGDVSGVHSHDQGVSPESYSRQAGAGTDAEPLDPPPGYEEVQQQSVANELEERLRRAS